VRVSLQPQLSSASTALRELTARITDLAERAAGTRNEDVATALYEVERSLRMATRRLDRLVADRR
jgi:phenylpyruvate tautomerase PptA (4-oxalocrotonate tautomerase family)